MAVINDPNTAANISRVAPVDTGTVQAFLRTLNSAIPHGALGHYRSSSRFLLAAAQTAGSRVWEVRNGHGANFVIPTRLVVRYVQSAAGTAQDNGLDIFKDTLFSVADTVNVITAGASVKRLSMATYSTSSTIIKQTTGAAAGMTGGTRTPDASPFCQVPISVQAAAAALVTIVDCLDDVNGTHPFVLGPNEGFEIQNRVLNVTSYGIMVYVDFSWAEVTLY